ncbi:MAG: radical SAM protein [Candidatus Sumerlaeia bacterium]|nr:radical SAM protein [Candidatus Sumerlaeia bacterium]
MSFEPAYLKLFRSGELHKRATAAHQALAHCTLCPRNCGVNRLNNELGYCRTGARAIVSSFGPHFGEEEPLVGRGGSGTIFFASCNLCCVFCQNFEISHEMEGREVEPPSLAGIMLHLQDAGCHNINFVTPSHVVPQILAALELAVERGLRLPLVYNTGGYDALETLRLLDGIVDIYMPDLKCMDREVARTYLTAEDYPDVVRAALREMHRQVGDLVLDDRGIALRGLLVRHLVMPNGLAGTDAAMRFLADEISRNTYVNVMAQYRPCGLADHYAPLARPISGAEYRAAVEAALAAGLTRLDERVARRLRL